MHWIKELRIKAGLSQEEFAGYLGISQSMLHFAENGKRELGTWPFLKIVDLMQELEQPMTIDKKSSIGIIMQEGIKDVINEIIIKKDKLLKTLEKLNAKSSGGIELFKKELNKLRVLEHMKNYKEHDASENKWVTLFTKDAGKRFTDSQLMTQVLLQLEIDAVKASIAVYDAFIDQYNQEGYALEYVRELAEGSEQKLLGNGGDDGK